MRAILVDPFQHTIEAVDTDGTLAAMYALIGCNCVERIGFDGRHTLWVDEDGLGAEPVNPATGEQGQRHFVLLSGDGFVTLIAGRALLLGSDDDGDPAAVNVTAQQLRARVAFPNDAKAAAKIADRLAADTCVICTPEEMAAARQTAIQRQREILALLAA